MGTIYYLAHAVNEERFPRASVVWAVSVTTILVSIVVHGVSATPVLKRLDARRERATRRDGASGEPSAAGVEL
jgi:NhaP-type Na+/H+ or K+/H+ antiporter